MAPRGSIARQRAGATVGTSRRHKPFSYLDKSLYSARIPQGGATACRRERLLMTFEEQRILAREVAQMSAPRGLRCRGGELYLICSYRLYQSCSSDIERLLRDVVVGAVQFKDK